VALSVDAAPGMARTASMASESTQQHRAQADSLGEIRVAVLTISDTRTPDTDKSGALMKELLAEGGFAVVHYGILKDEPALIRARVVDLCDGAVVDVVLTNGGTGIAPRDGTFEAIHGVLDRTMPGFGEIFRMLSFEEVGPAAMLSRAVAGLRGRTLVFCTPGSTNAVGLAMRRLIVPELRHIVLEMRGR